MSSIDDAINQLGQEKADRQRQLDYRALYGSDGWAEIPDLGAFVQKHSFLYSTPDLNIGEYVDMVSDFCSRIPDSAGRPAYAVALPTGTRYHRPAEKLVLLEYSNSWLEKRRVNADRRQAHQRTVRELSRWPMTRVFELDDSGETSKKWRFVRRMTGEWKPATEGHLEGGDWVHSVGTGYLQAWGYPLTTRILAEYLTAGRYEGGYY